MDMVLSKKLITAIVSIITIALNKKIGLDLSENDILAIAGVAAAYITGQSFIDTKKEQNSASAAK